MKHDAIQKLIDSNPALQAEIIQNQHYLAMIFSAILLAAILTLSKKYNLLWIPVIGFVIGYVTTMNTAYNHPMLAGLAASLLCSFFASLFLHFFNRRSTK
jgi:membrane protein implicated in regulation of membrane protease activity